MVWTDSVCVTASNVITSQRLIRSTHGANLNIATSNIIVPCVMTCETTDVLQCFVGNSPYLTTAWCRQAMIHKHLASTGRFCVVRVGYQSKCHALYAGFYWLSAWFRSQLDGAANKHKIFRTQSLCLFHRDRKQYAQQRATRTSETGYEQQQSSCMCTFKHASVVKYPKGRHIFSAVVSTTSSLRSGWQQVMIHS